MTKDKAYREIKRKIASEILKPGSRIVERDLCAMFGISRTPVREILRRLAGDGLIEVEQRRGYRVKKLSGDEIVAIFQARAAIEGMAARIACHSRDEAFFRAVASLKRELQTVNIDARTTDGIALGRRVHNSIIEASGNFLFHLFYDKLTDYALLTTNLTVKSVVIEKKSRDRHLEILEAIEARDPEESEKAMRVHLQETSRLLMERYYSAKSQFI